MGGKAMPMQARSRYYPRLADAKLTLRLTACVSLSTEARLSTLHWHRLLHPLLYLLIVITLRQLPTYLPESSYILPQQHNNTLRKD